MTTTDPLAVAAGDRFDAADRPELPAPLALAVPGSYHPPRTGTAGKSLTAAARQIDVTTAEGRRLARGSEGWHETVWQLIDEVPELKFASRFVGNALSRVRLYPGVIVDPREAPVDVREAVDNPEIGLPPQIAADAIAETERISSGPDGHGGMMRAFGELLTLTGDSLLVGRPAEDGDATMDDELWQVYSPSALKRDPGGRGLLLREAPNDDGRPLSDAIVYRVWRQHPRWRLLADANVRSVLTTCEELLLISRAMRSTMKSRNPAGLLLLPTELDPPAPGPRAQSAASGQVPAMDPDAVQEAVDGWTQFEADLIRSFIAPVEDDGSAASVVPHIIKGRAALLEKIRHLTLDRKIDEDLVARMEFLIRRLAHGVDLPVEVLTGMADANHWTGWQIEDSTYKAHVEPTAAIPASGLTAVHLRPALVAQGHDPAWVRRIAYGVDPSQLVVRPNRTADARAAYEAMAISRAAYLGYLGFPETDAPDEIEIATRYVLERGIGGQDITAQLWNLLQLLPAEVIEGRNGRAPITLPGLLAGEQAAEGEGGEPPAPDDEEPAEEGGDPLPPPPPAGDGDEAPAENAITAAAALPRLGRRLADVEAWARGKLLAEADAAMRRALEKAGARLRGAVQGDPDLAAEVNGKPAAEVGVILGVDRAPIVDVDQLLAGAFDPLEDIWRTTITAAEAQAAAVVLAETGVDVTDDGSADTDDAPPLAAAATGVEQAAMDQGWQALRLGLHAAAAPRVFALAEAEDGEADITSSVPTGVARDAMAVAGGGRAAAAPIGAAADAGPPGLLTGVRWRAKLRRAGVVARGYTWRTGMSAHPFAPHQALDGVEFDTWDDDALANHGRFPSVAHFYPGDHRGCTCDTEARMVSLEADEPADAPADAPGLTGEQLQARVLELGDESLTFNQAVARSQSVPVSEYGLGHDGPGDLYSLRPDLDAMTPSVERVPLGEVNTEQPTVNPHYIVKLYQDPLAAFEYDEDLANDPRWADYRPVVWRVREGDEVWLVLQDGHHRAIAFAARDGAEVPTFEANVYDIDRPRRRPPEDNAASSLRVAARQRPAWHHLRGETTQPGGTT